MNIFTNNDYKKIQAWLKANAIKDSDLETADVLRSEDIFTIVQNGKNKKTSLNVIKEFLATSNIHDEINSFIKNLQDQARSNEENILKNKNTIEALGLITAQGFQGVDESIAEVRKEINASIAEINGNIEKLSLDVSALFVYGGTMNLAFTDFINFCKTNLYAGNAPVKYIPDETNADHFILERSVITYFGSGITAKRECASVYRTGSNVVKTSEIRIKTYELP